jgi:hypothetical protein
MFLEQSARCLFGALLALAFLAGGTAQAAPSTVTVTNLGQAAMVSSRPQAPLVLASRNACATPFDAAQANGVPSPCGAGAWPETGGSAWAPVLDVAGGDTVELRFSGPVAAASVAMTTDFPVGLQTPDGLSVANVELLSPQLAEPTADPAVWRVVLPHLDRRMLTFSLVAVDGDGAAGFALGALAPRFADSTTRCGTYIVNTGELGATCSSAGVPSPSPLIQPPLVSRALALQIGSVAQLANRRLRVRIACSRAARLAVRVAVGTRTLAKRTVPARGGWQLVELARPRTSGAAQLRGRHVRVVVTATDAQGGHGRASAGRRVQRQR